MVLGGGDGCEDDELEWYGLWQTERGLYTHPAVACTINLYSVGTTLLPQRHVLSQPRGGRPPRFEQP